MLPEYGIEGVELEWTRSYFRNRRQVVSIGGQDSTELPIDYGVIQGGTLAAIFFLLFINKISNLSLNGKLYLFADDTAVLCEAESWTDLYSKANKDMNMIFQWLCGHSLSLNVQKTKYMVLSNSPSRRFLDEHHIGIHVCDNGMDNSCGCPRSKEYHTFDIWAYGSTRILSGISTFTRLHRD
ncbi:unnamed protein product [Nesidiocoris tenuis]|uniref:Reverse transcriptase domain-containing protein n=1 Tax=Nesidiocoris tenuis TaxID=355587 RepID=A0A6H5HN40_9HEMI|nr:unnamed protein product [Nesidiocoris tenuis]